MTQTSRLLSPQYATICRSFVREITVCTNWKPASENYSNFQIPPCKRAGFSRSNAARNRLRTLNLSRGCKTKKTRLNR